MRCCGRSFIVTDVLSSVHFICARSDCHAPTSSFLLKSLSFSLWIMLLHLYISTDTHTFPRVLQWCVKWVWKQSLLNVYCVFYLRCHKRMSILFLFLAKVIFIWKKLILIWFEFELELLFLILNSTKNQDQKSSTAYKCSLIKLYCITLHYVKLFMYLFLHRVWTFLYIHLNSFFFKS